jgi:uncharacterized protein (DUF952 family)
MRWLYHATVEPIPGEGVYAPASLEREGFIHASFQEAIAQSVALYFAGDSRVQILQIDPRRLGCPVEVVATPRGPMPHILGAINREAIVALLLESQLDSAPSAVD